MRFIDEIGILRRKVHLIDQLTQGPQWEPSEVDIIEAAFWARSVLDIIKNVEFNRYGHSLKTTIRTTRSVDDPDHPGSAKAVYEHNRNISLNDLLGFIIHFRYFAYSRHADGNHCLDVMSDRNVRQQVYYSDFTAALRSLVLSKETGGPGNLRNGGTGLATNGQGILGAHRCLGIPFHQFLLPPA